MDERGHKRAEERLNSTAAENRASYPTVSAEELVEFLSHSAVAVRKAAVMNPKLPKEAMVRIARTGNKQMKVALAENPALFVALQRQLLKESSLDVLVGLARNKAADPSILRELTTKESHLVGISLAKRTSNLPLWLQESLAKHSSKWVRMVLAKNPIVEPRVLAILAKDPELSVRERVAQNLQTSPDTLLEMSMVQVGKVGWHLAKNENIPEAAMWELLKDPHCLVSLAQNPSLGTEIAVALAKSNIVEVRQFVLRHPNLPEETQMRLALELRGEVWQNADMGICGSARVTKWLFGYNAFDQKISRNGDILKMRCGEVEIQVKTQEGDWLEDPLSGREVNPFGIYGWWGPKMGDRWVCLVDGPVGCQVGGIVAGGSEEMAKAQFFTAKGEDGDEAWLHSEWEIREEGEILVAQCEATKVKRGDWFPDLPLLQPTYENPGKATQCLGILRYLGDTLALWADEKGNEVGWERVSGFAEAQAPHEVSLIWEEDENQNKITHIHWDRLESILRKVAWGRAL